MKLATFTHGTHDPNCSGCFACDEQVAQLFDDQTNSHLRTAVARPHVFRTSGPQPTIELKGVFMREEHAPAPPPPDLNAAIRAAAAAVPPTAKMRAAAVAAFLTPPPPPRDDRTSQMRVADQ